MMHPAFLVVLLCSLTRLPAAGLPPLPEPVTSFGAVRSAGHLYVYGGHLAGSHEWSKETTSDKLQRLDLNKPEKWETVSSGPAVQSPGLAAHDGDIYLVGGMQPQNPTGKEKPLLKSLSHAAFFTPATGVWTRLPDLPEPRSSHDIAVLDGKLYAVGGWRLDIASGKAAPDDEHAKRHFHNTMLVLDLAKPVAWRTLPQPFERRAAALVASRGKLYCAGGMDAKNQVTATASVYDPATETWAELPELPLTGKMKAFGAAACALEERVMVSPSGGKVYVLAKDEQTWTETGRLQQSRFFHQLEPWSGNRLIALGGTKGGEPLDSVEIISLAAPVASTRELAPAKEKPPAETAP